MSRTSGSRQMGIAFSDAKTECHHICDNEDKLASPPKPRSQFLDEFFGRRTIVSLGDLNGLCLTRGNEDLKIIR